MSALVAEFNGKCALLKLHIKEKVLLQQTVLQSLSGSKKAHYTAAAMYSLPMLKALKLMYGGFTECDAIDAAEVGNLENLKYIHQNSDICNQFTVYRAAENGHLDCLKYLHENSVPWHPKTIFIAANNGHLDCLKYACEHGCPVHHQAVWAATGHGHLQCLEYLYENCHDHVYEMTDLMITAAFTGHLDCMQYLHEHGGSLDGIAAWAASGGKLNCLRYAHDNHDSSWNSSVPRAAASNGHLDCLMYAHENGCMIDSNTLSVSIGDCIEYCQSKVH